MIIDVILLMDQILNWPNCLPRDKRSSPLALLSYEAEKVESISGFIDQSKIFTVI